MAEPFVSVLVPVRNEERYIERCLYSLARQDYPRNRFEVLVIDGRSTDSTREIVARFAAESTMDVRLLDNPRQTTAAGLNVGLDEAAGDVILRVDGHASVEHDFMSRGVFTLFDRGADCVGGVIESEGDTYVGRAIAAAMSSRFGVGGVSFRIGGEGPVETVAFGAYRRDVFDRIGRFAEDIDKGEDDEFNYRLCDAGGLILLVPGVRASYTVRGDLRGLWRQYFGYGRAKPFVLARHPAQARARQFAPAALVAAGAASTGLALAGRPTPLKWLAWAYGGATILASAAVVPRRGWKPLPVLPATFACLHLSYGLGFIAGLSRLAGKTLVHQARPGARRRANTPM